uniref:Uncharacterized protein n=1 Tax=Anopheles christyi TaxID=43041 RepID=A0A182KIN8_9DIPT
MCVRNCLRSATDAFVLGPASCLLARARSSFSADKHREKTASPMSVTGTP